MTQQHSSLAFRWALRLHPAAYRAEHQAELTAIYTEVAAVAELAKTVERHCGRPQDIEWAVPRDAAPLPDGGPDVLLLQTRPETFWSHRPRARVEVVPGAGVSSIADTMLGLGSLPT